jgi:hypothetical protein
MLGLMGLVPGVEFHAYSTYFHGYFAALQQGIFFSDWLTFAERKFTSCGQRARQTFSYVRIRAGASAVHWLTGCTDPQSRQRVVENRAEQLGQMA